AFRVGADGAVGFDVQGADPARRLVIDPLVWATFLGGGGNEEAHGVGLDPGGDVVVAGEVTPVYSEVPVARGAYRDSGERYDAFVARISSDGSNLIWATFLGGASFELAFDVAVGT